MNWSVFRARSFRLPRASSSCFSATLRFRFEDTKLIKNDPLWMFWIAKEASEGRFGLILIILSASSFIPSTMASNSLLLGAGFFSFISLTEATINGFSWTMALSLNRFFPWIMIVVLPSGIWSTLRMRATVPISYTSSTEGASTEASRCATTPIVLLPWLAALIRAIEVSRPAVIGMTTPGNKTVLRRGKIGKVSGTSSRSISSSSSGESSGMSSASSSIEWADKLSNPKYIFEFIKSFTSFCHPYHLEK